MALALALALACERQPVPAPAAPTPLPIRGADLSMLPALRASGLRLLDRQGRPADPLRVLRDAGATTIRLRLWVDPADGVSAYPAVSALAREVEELGMDVMLCVHYSDTWADPGQQHTPARWQNLELDALADSLYSYTRRVVEGIRPRYVQIGNEINNGMLWPQGHAQNGEALELLLARAAKAVREARTGSQILLHYAGHRGAQDFFERLGAIDHDLIGLSYYPIWHGPSLDSLGMALQGLSRRHGKGVMVVETSYAFSLGWNDWTGNIIGAEAQLLPSFAATPKGQRDFLAAVLQQVRRATQPAGFCYWGGEWVSFAGPQSTEGSSWENQALWDFEGRALMVLDNFAAEP